MLTLTAQLGSTGSVEALLDSTMAKIRKEPVNALLRVKLFQLYCITGDWKRALGQLASAASLDPETEEMARAYREVIRCEVYRAMVFSGAKAPLFLGEPEIWLAKLLESLRLNAVGSATEAANLRAMALSVAPATTGMIGEQPFEWIADMDSRLGPVLEAIINGKYYWVPFHQLQRVQIEAPVDMRDLVWAPAKLLFSSGGEQVAFLPVRYSGTETLKEDSFLLARKTEWQALGSEGYSGLGQRMFFTDQGEYSMLDTRLVILSQSA